MLNRYLFLLCISTLLPLHVFAASEFDFLQMDIDAIRNELTLYQKELSTQESSAEYEQQNDLFPLRSVEDQMVKKGNYVEIESNGRRIALTDVPYRVWFAKYVQDIAQQKIISGYSDEQGNPLGTYGPADTVTIEQLAKIAVLASQADVSKCPKTPKNERAQHRWSSVYISCAEHLGWSVYTDATVDPSREALRADVVATILQAFHREMIPATGTVFRDVSNTMPSRYAIETAAHDGIVSGYTDQQGNLTGYFGPFDTVNRAQTAKIVSLALQTYSP